MGLKSVLAPLFGWLIRGAVLKVSAFGVVFALIGFFVPMAVHYLAPFLGIGNLTNVFSVLPPGVWFFLDFFRLDLGLPLLISAAVARFLIRRLPIIG